MTKAKQFLVVFGIFAALIATNSCAKKDSDGDSNPTCDLSSNFCVCDQTLSTAKACVENEGSKRESEKKDCTSGTFKTDAACPSTGRIGTCKLTLLSVKTYYRYYTADSAITGAAACATLWLSTGGIGVYEWIDD